MLTACANVKDLFDFSSNKSEASAALSEKVGTFNPVAQAAKKAGVVECLERVHQVANFLTTGNAQSGATLSIPPQNPNERIVSAAFEIQTPQVLSYASADFAPLAGGCEGTYEAVVYWDNNCDTVANKAFAQFKRANMIKNNIMTLQGSSTQLRVFLMPAGSGCVTIHSLSCCNQEFL
jgi:hypothetical protein